jgi:hypothetical protein
MGYAQRAFIALVVALAVQTQHEKCYAQMSDAPNLPSGGRAEFEAWLLQNPSCAESKLFMGGEERLIVYLEYLPAGRKIYLVHVYLYLREGWKELVDLPMIDEEIEVRERRGKVEILVGSKRKPMVTLDIEQLFERARKNSGRDAVVPSSDG